MASNIGLRNNINTEFLLEHSDNKPAGFMSSHDISRTVDTVADMEALIPTGATASAYDKLVCVVRDLDRGGTFIYDSTKVADDNQGTNFKGWIRQYSGAVNIKWFGAKGDGSSDDSVLFISALSIATSLYIPSGSYKINITISKKIVLYGDGSSNTRLYPYDVNKAAIIYGVIDTAWDYPSSVKDIGFYSSNNTGIGFAFGKDNVADYVAQDEYKRNVAFYSCYFNGFDKAIFRPFGAIGVSFYSCGFAGNKYGTYSLNNKFGGIMHPGNIYFYSCEFDSNICANYINNTADGFGGVVFNGTIFEANNITNYIYSSAQLYSPISYKNCWFESNGQFLATVTSNIDQWSGTVLSTIALTNSTLIFDGYTSATFDGGRPTGIACIGDNCSIVINNATLATVPGYGGEPFSTAGNSSILCDKYIKVSSLTAPGSNLNISYSNPVLTAHVFGTLIDSSNQTSTYATFVEKIQQTVNTGGNSASKFLSNTFEAAVGTGNGSFSLTGTVVADGVIFGNCNEYTRSAFTTAQFTAITSIQPTVGYVVISYYIKCTVGSIRTYSWNRSTEHAVGGVLHTAGDGWRLVSALRYTDGSLIFYPIDFNGTGVDATWRVSALQAMVFSSLQDAYTYFNSRTFTV